MTSGIGNSKLSRSLFPKTIIPLDLEGERDETFWYYLMYYPIFYFNTRHGTEIFQVVGDDCKTIVSCGGSDK